MNPFEKLGVSTPLLKAISDAGFTAPTAIQQQALPLLIEGTKDFIGLAQTGTGKTAAFGLPLLQLVDPEKKYPQALVLSPTRELCVQIVKDLMSFAKYLPSIRVVAVYGGAGIAMQAEQLRKGAHIVVATPGRLLDLIRRKTADLSKVRWAVLDESDEMLNMGFQEDINAILDKTPHEKNTWLFSATMPPEVRRIAQNYMSNPVEITVGRKNAGAENIEHIYFLVNSRNKYAALKRLVDFSPEIFGIVFCRTKMESQEVAEHLIRDGYNADALHGDLSQPQRDKVMKRFRDRSLQLLVATDVAARGIDVNDVTHVIHYNLPDEPENYTHRSGRTARAGKSGVSVSLVSPGESGKIRAIEKITGKKFTHGKIPAGKEVCERQLLSFIHKIHEVEVNEAEIRTFLPAIFDELKDLSREDIIKRFASIEFNRFLDYYRNAPDLNADAGARRPMHRGEDTYSTGKKFFINLGAKDGFDTGRMLAYIQQTTGIDRKKIGKIDVKGVYTFFNTDDDVADRVAGAFQGEEFKGRTVRVESGGRATPSSSGEKYGHTRPFRKDERSYGEKKDKRFLRKRKNRD